MKYAFTPLQFGETPEEFCKIKSLPPKNSLFFYSTPKEILNFFKMAPEEFHGSSPGWEVGGRGPGVSNPYTEPMQCHLHRTIIFCFV